MHGPGSGVPRGCGMRQWALACVLVAAACGGASQSSVRPLGGILTVAPAMLDFGDVALGREQTQRVVLRNTGLVSMTVGQLAQFADPAFEVKGLPETLGPGSAVDVAVRYRPPRGHLRSRQFRDAAGELAGKPAAAADELPALRAPQGPAVDRGDGERRPSDAVDLRCRLEPHRVSGQRSATAGGPHHRQVRACLPVSARMAAGVPPWT